jgi:hypothetical protein
MKIILQIGGVAPTLGVRYMKGGDGVMKEIVKVRDEHGTLYIRIPRSFIREHGINKRSYCLWYTDRQGFIKLKPLNKETIRDKEFDDDTD